MGLFDFVSKKEVLTPEEAERKLIRVNKEIEKREKDLQKTQDKLTQVKQECLQRETELKILKNEIDEEMQFIEYGLFEPTYKFANSDMYKERLKIVRDQEKLMIKNKTACTGATGWAVNGNLKQGQKMVSDLQKLLLRAFNTECDDIIRNVTVSNYERSKEKIYKSAQSISKLGEIAMIRIVEMYVGYKQQELILALEFEQVKQAEKERLRELREQQKEEAKAQKEIEEAKKKLEKEQTHYRNALEKINQQLVNNPDNPDLLAKRAELEETISETEKAIADVDYREANKRAGYVYIISNIGAFGENVYKIGMTRRLEPLDRISELSGASVPFNFDVHALIFTEDAPGLESALHKAFEDKKVNKINTRREFFYVSLNEIKQVVRQNFDKTVEWIDVAEAEQYRQTVAMNRESGILIEREHPKISVETTPIANTISESRNNGLSIESISETVQAIASENIPDYKCQTEDTGEFYKLHIYTTGNQKIGIIKIAKADLSIQFRKFGNGMPVVHNLQRVEEFKNLI